MGSVCGVCIGVDHAAIRGAGLGILAFDGEVLSQCKPVCSCSFIRSLHQGKFPFDRRAALLGASFPDRISHLARHRFDLLVFPDRGFHRVGFQIVLERLRMILNQVRPFLVGIMGTTCQYQTTGKDHRGCQSKFAHQILLLEFLPGEAPMIPK